MKTILQIVALVVLLSGASLFVMPAQAQDGEIPSSSSGGGSGGGGQKQRVLFGGRILDVDPCTCPLNGAYLWMRIGPPRAQEIVLTFSSLLYLHYAFKKGNLSLGDAGPVKMSCMDWQASCGKKGCSYFCASTAMGFPVIHIGTSLGEKFQGGGGSYGGGGASGGF